MLLRIIFLGSWIWLGSIAAIAQTALPFTLSGQLTGFADSTEVKLIRNGESTFMAVTQIIRNQFVLQGELTEPSLCLLYVGNQSPPAELFLEGGGTMVLRGSKDNPAAWQLEGSSSHLIFKQFLAGFIPYLQLRNQVATELNGTTDQKVRDSLMLVYTTTNATLQQVVDRLVADQPGSSVTSFVLAVTYGFFNDLAWLEKSFALLQPVARQSVPGRQLETMIQDGKIGAVGSQALDFTQADTSGKMVSLSSFRGKYVLVDFWASWCGPCRQENPNVVSNFRKFKSKNFTVLGVSLDREDQRAKWIEAIKKDMLTWTHVSDLKFWNNEAARLYRVNGIPYNF